jgi:NhaC family Na+:H+ antiporter
VDALIPLLFMILLLVTSIVLFGIDAAVGPLQVALLMSAVVGAIVAHKNGHSWERLGEEIVKGISLAMTAILILLMVGALIGVWNMSGTIATMVYYGSSSSSPGSGCSLLCGLVSIVTGSSWTTAATLGLPLSHGQYHRCFTAITAGAVISGAYFGDKMTPLSETTILTPQIVGSNVYTHISSMAKATVPAYLISLVMFFFIGRVNEITAAVDTTATLQALGHPITSACGAAAGAGTAARLRKYSFSPS